jgi:hypothetical protein
MASQLVRIQAGANMGLWPTQGNENRRRQAGFGMGLRRLDRQLHLICHLDRSETGAPGKRSLLGWEAEWRDLRFPTSGAKSAPDMEHPGVSG